jgi:hypothetical protein
MKPSLARQLLLANVLLVFTCLASLAIEPISPAQFKQLHALIKPNATEERWTQIPWRTSLWEARQVAAAEGKPILLWEMDGHPLGCT